MGELNVKKLSNTTDKATYINHLLRDIEALEMMLNENLFEKEPIRIGAEQEFCLVNEQWDPSKVALNMLKRLDPDYFTTEIAQYNLEANLNPLPLTGNCFSQMHEELNTLLYKAGKSAEQYRSRVVLTGILPTIVSRHGGIEYMTPIERYKLLNETITEIRKRDIELHIKGVDELNIMHNSIMLEGCNTSFQCHLQINPDDFVSSYNWAQAIAAPILAISTNSPLLLGRELWSETRIALFAQSVNTRKTTFMLNEKEIRVGFGDDWFYDAVTDIFKDNILGYRSLLTSDFETDSVSILQDGNIPKLRALNLQNGTVYRWNRPCYGVGGEKPHLRIENRYIPSGPSTSDEIANMLLWVGIMRGRPEKYDNIHETTDFKDIKTNFFNAARYGMATQFYWDGKLMASHKLVLEELLPMAYKGLSDMGVSPGDIAQYLTIIENRVRTHSGSRWMVQSYRNLAKKHKNLDALRMLTAAIHENQEGDNPVSTWAVVGKDANIVLKKERRVVQYMDTKLFTVQEDESTELALTIMQWKNIRYMPVITTDANLKGLIVWENVKDYLNDREKMNSAVHEIMETNVITVTARASMKKAKKLMEDHKTDYLLVVEEEELLGMLTTEDC